MSTYIWSTGSTDSVFIPSKAGKYWVTVQNQCGQATDSVLLYSLADIFYPNVLTVNNDGKNEKFKVIGIGDKPEGSITIYNRWGESIFTETPYKNDWPINNDLASGTYYFILNFPGCQQKFKGWVELTK
jgi:gliding motility-associated-like protein